MMGGKIHMIKGFKAAAVSAGLKKDKAPDMALIWSETEAHAAGVFTTSRVQAAPVVLTRQNIADGRARVIIANSGNANACTGSQGLDDARRVAASVAEELGIRADDVLVASTGVIGRYLDMDRVTHAVPDLVLSLSDQDILPAARAIMTTDSFPKVSMFDGHAGRHAYRIQGIAKGAGMIMPNMATMLAFLMSDIRIQPDLLRKVVREAVEGSFNRITVDGDTSTNDMVLMLANGMAGNRDLSKEDLESFTEGLRRVTGDLARMIVRDGEGATKVIDVRVHGAMSAAEALRAARTVANSSLVKTAFYGEDPNWGRIMAALGRAGIRMKEDCVDIWMDDVKIVHNGLGNGMKAEKKASGIMTGKEFSVTIDLKQGMYRDRVLTCDLTHEYVSINADYRT